MSKKIINPILSGFYPDPSVCVANGKFYLVNSSFSYFPGLPIFESSDCCEWTQIGNIIDQDSQLNFSGQGVSRGLFAPTIRYNNGKFYCICTQVDRIGNFFVTADKPEGPWSDPIVIEGAEGIDPSLFFDDDGTVWYIGTRPAPEGCKYNGNWEIWIQQIDINTGKLLGDSKGIWRGALKDCVWPEGPHIYKIDGMYYLLHAEGGTGPDHAVCVARCATIDGEWEGKKSNPILTHRHLGKSAGVVYVGHADLFCDNNNRWWMVCLASRPYGQGENRCCNMGRATFLVPVKWEDGWPVAMSQMYSGEKAVTKLKTSNLYGNWDIIIFDKNSVTDDHTAVVRNTSQTVSILKNATVTQNDIAKKKDLNTEKLLRKSGDGFIVIIDSVEYMVYPAILWDWELGEGSLTFSGIGADGSTIWGKKNTSGALGIYTDTFYYVLDMCDDATKETYEKKIDKISSNPSQSQIDSMTNSIVAKLIETQK